MMHGPWMVEGSSHKRRHSFFLVFLLVLLTVCSTCRASSSSYTLFHRFGPSLTGSHSTNNRTAYEWQKWAVLEISTAEINLEKKPQSSDVNFLVSSFNKSNQPLKIPSSAHLETLEYQISLLPHDSQELPGESGQHDARFGISSYPLCAFLFDQSSSKQGPINEYLNIWITPTAISFNSEIQPSLFHNLQLDLLGIHWSRSSPPTSSLSSSRRTSCDDYLSHSGSSISEQSDQYSVTIGSRLQRFIEDHTKSAIKVSVRKPEKLIEPLLKPYPTHRNLEYLPDGRVKEPAPEKGFLAKYWMYILPVVVLLVMGGGQPPEENGGSDQPQPPQRSQ